MWYLRKLFGRNKHIYRASSARLHRKLDINKFVIFTFVNTKTSVSTISVTKTGMFARILVLSYKWREPVWSCSNYRYRYRYNQVTPLHKADCRAICNHFQWLSDGSRNLIIFLSLVNSCVSKLKVKSVLEVVQWRRFKCCFNKNMIQLGISYKYSSKAKVMATYQAVELQQ